MYTIYKYQLHLILALTMLAPGVYLVAQCVPISANGYQACIETIDVKKQPLKKLRNAPAQSVEALFYAYFEGTDYQGYQQLFLPKDWYGLSEFEFNTWRNNVKSADIEILSTTVLFATGRTIGMIKYAYILDDQLIYETFLAKKTGADWRPSSAKEDQDYGALSSLIKYTNPNYLQSLLQGARTKSTDSSTGVSNGSIVQAKLMEMKDSLKIYQPEVYALRYNDDFAYLTRDKYNSDRLHDASFTAFMDEMQLLPEHQGLVMQLILAQDYIRAATLADQFSSVTYTYSPFVDKIREVYGRDRIKKWDSINQKWD